MQFKQNFSHAYLVIKYAHGRTREILKIYKDDS